MGQVQPPALQQPAQGRDVLVREFSPTWITGRWPEHRVADVVQADFVRARPLCYKFPSGRSRRSCRRSSRSRNLFQIFKEHKEWGRISE